MNLERIRNVPLPFAPSPPLAARAFAGRLHLVAADLARGAVQHVAVGADGSGPPTPLPLAYPMGLVACRDRLVATGATADQRPVALHLDADGTVTARTPLPAEAPLLREPVPVCLADGPVVAWESYAGQGSVLTACRLTGDRAELVGSIGFPLFTPYADVAAAGHRLVAARVDPATLELALTALDDRLRPATTTPVAAGVTAVCLAAVAAGLIVGWVETGGRLLVRRFDTELAPSSPVITAAVVEPPATVSAVRLAADGHRLAVLHQTLLLADPRLQEGSAPPVLEHPQRTTAEAVTAVDLASAAVAGSTVLPQPAGTGGVAAADWLDGSLLVLHADTAAVSFYRT